LRDTRAHRIAAHFDDRAEVAARSAALEPVEGLIADFDQFG
jgi:hypothetical protein